MTGTQTYCGAPVTIYSNPKFASPHHNARLSRAIFFGIKPFKEAIVKKHISIIPLFILTAAVSVFGQTTWLDRSLNNNWNNGNGVVPNAPRTLAPIDARCQSQVRQPDSMADRAVTRAGWSLFGAAQTFGQVTMVNGMAGADGMCRPLQYNTFVFVNNRFAGTLSPTTMDSRSDSSMSTASLNSMDSITAEFSRYGSNDALCCPSRQSMVTYLISSGSRPIVRADDIHTTDTCPDNGGVSTQDNVVSGTITYRQRMALPSTAVTTVRLVDVSRADAPSTTIVEQRVETAGKQVPFSFEFAYDRSRINERNRYAVQAEIRDGGRLIFITDTSYPVITQGNPKNVEIVLVPVGGAGGGQGTGRNVVRGTVTYLQRIAMPTNAEVRVWLVDAAAPNSTPVAETTFATAGRQMPYQFELRYEARDIDRQRNYEVRAEIRSNGQTRMRSTAGKAVNLRGFQNDPVEIIVAAGGDEPTVVTGRSLSLSKFGTGSMKIGDRTAQFLVRGSVVVRNDGTATGTVGTISNQTVFTGRVTFLDDSTIRIAVDASGDADASGEIEVSYTDRRLNRVTGRDLILDGQNVVLSF